MNQAILDTDTLSYILDNRYPDVDTRAKQYLRVFRFFSVTVISVCEIIEGLEAIRDHSAAVAFQKSLESFEVFPIETEEAVVAGQILGALSRSHQPIGDLDPFVAAVAIVNQRPLVTNNHTHFQRIVDLGFPLTLENWRNA
ncbi:MAG: PIN domain-containing protein [Capsulimonadaceae bacterium]